MISEKRPNATYVRHFRELDQTKTALAGGKGANLGELFIIPDIAVPDGFCVLTKAYESITRGNDELKALIDDLSAIKAADRETISYLSGNIRSIIEQATIPAEIVNEITAHLSGYDHNTAFAVRSSATAEDLPGASFAGQQDTWLNVIGQDAVLKHISKCWASLFTDRAVTYRIQNDFDHHKVQLAVIVQQMVFPQASGIMFTADPVNGNRKVVSIDAGFGLGEALVSGLTNADNYKVWDGQITDKNIANKKRAIYGLKEGGTKELQIEPGRQNEQAINDGQILQLEKIGRQIEAHFGAPQDMEWCLANDRIYIVQSRPVTTLFPVPHVNDNARHVYVSVGHQQMMTDAMKPLGLSVWQLTAARPMFTAGGRLFVDVAPILTTSAGRDVLINTLGKSDPLIKDALQTVIDRDFIKLLPDEANPSADKKVVSPTGYRNQVENDPAIAAAFIKKSEESVALLKQDIQNHSGVNLFDFILNDRDKLRPAISHPQNLALIMAGMDAAAWLNEKMEEWLGEKNVADMISQSVPNNITSEMGLALMELADVIRPYPAIVAYLQQIRDDNFLNELLKFNGGKEVRDAVIAYLDKYGMRCAGEIDITKTRWSEKPAILIPLIFNNIKNFAPGAAKKKFEQGLHEAAKKEEELLSKLKQLPGGSEKAAETKRMIDVVRNFAGYREYPKYGMICRYFIYKQALLKEAERLVNAGIIKEKEDVFYLTFEEFREAVATHRLDQQLINRRKEEYIRFEKLTPPRVMTSEGEIITGSYKRENLPAGATIGLAVSSGTVEGRARVIFDIKNADVDSDDILVTTFTDPSWTPLFVSIKGLVTEVGGLMTHGAVIAREYGLPAVVGVENATKLIKDGQRIRINGTDGFIELL